MNLEIWGRSFELDVVYDAYCGEEVSQEQRDALDKFLSVADELFAVAEVKAKEYCLDMNGDEIGEEAISNIFKYVVPKAVYVSRTDGARVVAILCHYKFNMDDGVAIVFENEEFSEIGTEDIIL